MTALSAMSTIPPPVTIESGFASMIRLATTELLAKSPNPACWFARCVSVNACPFSGVMTGGWRRSSWK